MNILYVIYFGAILFPYIGYFPLPIDTQPYALIIGVIYLVLKSYVGLQIPKLTSYLIVPIIVSVLLGINNLTTAAMRSIIGYISVFVFFLSAYNLLKNPKIYNIFLLTLKCSVVIWLTGGVIELVVGNGVWSPLLNNLRPGGGAGRGGNSFAPEPTYWGMHCIFLMIINNLTVKNKYIEIALIVQILILSRSSMAVMFIMIIYGIELVKVISFGKLIKYLALILIFVEIAVNYFSETRISTLISYVINNPLKLINSDVSINSRIGHVIFSLIGAFDSWFIPRGYDNFGNYLTLKLQNIDWYVWLADFGHEERIMSGIGGAIFELGIFGVAYVVFIYMVGTQGSDTVKSKLFAVVLIYLIMLTAQPLTYPLFGVLLAIVMLKGKGYINVRSLIG